MTIQLYNTLSRQKEAFQPLLPDSVGLYTCGPTVYNYAHIGNLRTYLFEDLLKRTLAYNGYQVKHVMNITDVGHLSGDMDMGEDKMEKGAAREGRSAWEIAEFYTEAFRKDLALLNIQEPSIWCKATDNIPEQIALVEELERKGYTYLTSDGVYFDTAKFKDYNKLSHLKLDDLKEGARVEVNEEKRNPTDFALWKFSPAGQRRQMEWQSPWGLGFPGWHLECSAMSMKFLGEQLDIHCGGIDHINVHHTNEIAQSECATERQFFRYWLHGAFLNIAGGKKMAKAEGNFLTLDKALLQRGLDAMVYRYAALQVHYRKPMEYAEEIMDNAAAGLAKLKSQVAALGSSQGRVDEHWRATFLAAINDDLNSPEALAVLYELLKSDVPAADRLATALDFDRVLGLNLADSLTLADDDLPQPVSQLWSERQAARTNKDWAASDRLRDELAELGYLIEDGKEGSSIRKK